ncbi:hypothetical protein FB451DRAFT_1172231 [Mycena latifolia]|nr:hypothetical protein FB451DRAFT_1172231 [Mycena latifolia]
MVHHSNFEASATSDNAAHICMRADPWRVRPAHVYFGVKNPRGGCVRTWRSIRLIILRAGMQDRNRKRDEHTCTRPHGDACAREDAQGTQTTHLRARAHCGTRIYHHNASGRRQRTASSCVFTIECARAATPTPGTHRLRHAHFDTSTLGESWMVVPPGTGSAHPPQMHRTGGWDTPRLQFLSRRQSAPRLRTRAARYEPSAETEKRPPPRRERQQMSGKGRMLLRFLPASLEISRKRVRGCGRNAREQGRGLREGQKEVGRRGAMRRAGGRATEATTERWPMKHPNVRAAGETRKEACGVCDADTDAGTRTAEAGRREDTDQSGEQLWWGGHRGESYWRVRGRVRRDQIIITVGAGLDHGLARSRGRGVCKSPRTISRRA